MDSNILIALCFAIVMNKVSGQVDLSPVCNALKGAIFDDIGTKQGLSGQFYLSRGRTYHFDAEMACQQIGGHLVEFESKQKFEIVTDCIKDRVINFEDIRIGGQVDPLTGAVTSSFGINGSNAAIYSDFHSRAVRDLVDTCLSLMRRPRGIGVKMVGKDCSETTARYLCEL